MDKKTVEQALKVDLGDKKELIALKPLKELPKEIPAYQGVATPGLCAQVGEVLKQGSLFYTTRENHQCYEGLIATGVCEVSREEYRTAVEGFIEEFPYHKDVDTAMSFYDDGVGLVEDVVRPRAEVIRIAGSPDRKPPDLHSVDALEARREFVPPRDVVARARGQHFDLVMTRQQLRDESRVQFGAAVDVRAVALDHDSESHWS